MLLTIDTFDARGKPSSHTCSVGVIEDSADFLRLLISEQHTLLLAYVCKGDNRTFLPLGAFTSSSVESIPLLLHHWQAILSISLLSALPQSHTEIMIDLTRRLINQYVIRLATHERMIIHFNQCIQRIQNSYSPQQGAAVLIYEYELSISKHEEQLNKVQLFLDRMTKRLNQFSH